VPGVVDLVTQPRRIPRHGAVLRLRPTEWRRDGPYGPIDGDRDLTLLVDQAQPEISREYGGEWCWVSGTDLVDNRIVGEVLVLVHVDAIPRQDAAFGWRGR
jgi:hypothetical protein